jgi:hypothetical protein
MTDLNWRRVGLYVLFGGLACLLAVCWVVEFVYTWTMVSRIGGV